MTYNTQIGQAFLEESAHRLDKSFQRMLHCLNQLDEQDIWWRPNGQMNSVGNLILHLNGNLRQWILHGIGGQEDVRNRPEEFEHHQTTGKQGLRELLLELKAQIEACLATYHPDQLMDHKRIQGFDTTALKALYSTMTHLEGHTGQIVYITRWKKGAQYQIFWKPESEEQESKNKQ